MFNNVTNQSLAVQFNSFAQQNIIEENSLVNVITKHQRDFGWTLLLVPEYIKPTIVKHMFPNINLTKVIQVKCCQTLDVECVVTTALKNNNASAIAISHSLLTLVDAKRLLHSQLNISTATKLYMFSSHADNSLWYVN